MVNEVRELNRQYAGSYIYYKGEGENVPFLVERIDIVEMPDIVVYGGALNNPGVEREGKHKPDHFLLSQERYELEFPTLGAINDGPYVSYIKRRIRRQWTRGLYHNIVKVYNPCRKYKRISEKKSNDGNPLPPPLVYSIYNRVYYSPKQAVQEIKNYEAVGRAVNKKVYLILPFNRDEILICYKDKVAGSITQDNKVSLFEAMSHTKEEIEEAGFVTTRTV